MPPRKYSSHEDDDNRVPRPRLKKGLGQHLLRDRRAANRIVRSLAVEPGEPVLEIGPGLGALTIPLLRLGARVVGVERDSVMAEELLRRAAGEGELTIIQENILDIRLQEICRAEGSARLKIVGNIPYRITSPILHWLLGELSHVTLAVLTMQREVAERLLAKPGSKSYGSLTLAVGQKARVEMVREMAPEAFRPRPKVSSTALRLIPRSRPAVQVPDQELLESLIRRSFGQRRKMLRRSLAADGTWSPGELEAAAKTAGISLTRRPEELSLQEFGSLCRALWELAGDEGGRGTHEVSGS